MKRKPEDEDRNAGMTRRSFIKGVGVGAAAAAAASGTFSALAAAEAKEVKPEEMQKLTLKVNGRSHRLLVEPRWSLLFVLREKMGLSGTKVGCERGGMRGLYGLDQRRSALRLYDPCPRGGRG